MPVPVVCPKCKGAGDVPRSKIGCHIQCFGCGHEFEVMAPPAAGQRHRYKMVPLEPVVEVGHGPAGDQAAAHLQEVVAEYASQGWEFHRVDAIGCLTSPGCLGALMGLSAQQVNYYVVTFRRGATE